MDITPSVLDGGQQIIPANWPSYKRIICTYNNNIPVNILSHPYVLLDRKALGPTLTLLQWHHKGKQKIKVTLGYGLLKLLQSLKRPLKP